MKRSARKFAVLSLACWSLLILLGFLTQRARPRPDEARLHTMRLEHQVRLLEEEVASLKARLALPSVLDSAAIGGFQPLPARMTPVPDLSPSRRSAILDIGSADGVEAGFGVISKEQLIGRVAEVGRHHARVMLADDPEFRIRFARVPAEDEVTQEGRSEEGIAAGGPRHGLLECQFQRDPMHVVDGDLIVSAGGEGVFPRGVVIGATEHTEGADFRIRMQIDPLTVREVMVLAQETAIESPEEFGPGRESTDERAGG